MSGAGDALIARIARLYRSEAQAGGAAAAMLTQAADALDVIAPAAGVGSSPRLLPVRDFLPAAIADAARGPLAALAADFARIEPGCAWRQNPNYTAATIGSEFLARYGYVELVGPAGPAVSGSVRVGFLLLGPRTHYPDHAHPAIEAYHVVGGEAEWWDETGGWRVRPLGAMVFHPSRRRHATRTGEAPLLALYGWIGEVGTEARLA